MREPRARPPEIVHQDRHFLVVDKPPGLPTTSPQATEPSLVRWVTRQVGDGTSPHPTSRLDAPVSGLVTFALTSHGNRHLLEARKAGEYGRTYIGLTVGEVAFGECEWNWPISLHPTNPKLRVASSGKGERDALTRCLVAARVSCGAVLRLTPVTGRTHQIRVHAARGGVPLFGDHAYGGARRFVLSDGSVASARRVMLHCSVVRFPRMGDHEEFVVRSPIPLDMRGAWEDLGGTSTPFDGH